MWKHSLSIYTLRQRLKRVAAGMDPYVSSERYFEYSLVLRRLEGLPAGASILDVGSNDSLLPTILAERGYIVTCVDPYHMVRRQEQFAQAMGNGYRIRVMLAEGEKLPFRECSFVAEVLLRVLGQGTTVRQ